MGKYMNGDGELKDDKIATDIRRAADMYENGELVETHDLLLEVINAIDDFDAREKR